MEILKIVNELKIICKHSEIIENYDTSLLSSYALGGPAQVCVFPYNEPELIEILKFLRGNYIKTTILGGGTNILISDRGITGVTVVLSHLQKLKVTDNIIKTGAGVSSSDIASIALKNNLTGAEFLAGLPGTIGGAAWMNARAFGSEISRILRSARVLDYDGNISTYLNNSEDFEYKSSPFRKYNFIITELELELSSGNPEDIKLLMDSNYAHRHKNGETKWPSCGCVFKNPPGASAGKLIDDCSLKGKKEGNVFVSNYHANFIVYEGSCTASSIKTMMETVRKEVYEKKKVLLEYEVEFIGDWN
ncbi:UDP-N-acetylmuramate dehydrogenase [Myxococcota bacterium]|nr:UDP-N-acetylmuramate dehydrogenase [Myxococcota bacterium]MBU1380539.1 UDP-N-acetylmuramate dehydrogenase [Myxococcota bacterium]MBU1497310.1 UDP-N-acetylmuramate dehydrogenase [Myxococcota bacterium]